MLEPIKFHDMKIIKVVKKKDLLDKLFEDISDILPIPWMYEHLISSMLEVFDYTLYRIFYKQGDKSKKKNHAVLLQWTTYLRAWALHSTPETSLVNLFTDEGFDVYLVDWGDNTYFMSKGGTFNEYIQYALDIFDFVYEDAGKKPLHYFGICEGSVLAQCVSSLRSDKVKSLSFNDLILNSDHMGITNLLMDLAILPLTDNVFTKFMAKFFNLPPLLNEWFLNNILYSPVAASLMRLQAMKSLPPDQFISSGVWAFLDVREIEYSHHIYYADVVYDNLIFDGKFEPDLPKEGKRKIDLNKIKSPIYSIIGALDNYTAPAGSFIERSTNPFGTDYKDIIQDIIPTGHNFWLLTPHTENVRKRWLIWVKSNDT